AFESVLDGFSEPLAWMILSAFHIGCAVEKSGLGKRVAYWLVSKLGSSILGLGYAICGAELVLAPFVPSNTARGGSIVLPIVTSVVQSLGSFPSDHPESGAFLMLLGSHANLLISSLFVTGAASNLVVVKMAVQVLGIKIGFLDWLKMSFLPGMTGVCLMPIVLMRICKPDYSSNCVEEAEEQLKTLGSLSVMEKRLLCIMTMCLVLWTTGSVTGLPESLVAFLGLLSLMVLDVLEWDDIASNGKAWDTFFWIAGMVMFGKQLTVLGLAGWIGKQCALGVQWITHNGVIGALLMGLLYFFSMYLFSSTTAHATALAGPLLAAGKVIGAPVWLQLALFSSFTSLSACLTPFSSGSVALYFSTGFVSQKEWLRIGWILAMLYLVIYMTVGLLWWRLILPWE
ncbi:Sodium/sulfate symporter, partial [Gorgonomyces haynaldii]